ncbi:MAG: LysM peptidoglycan-binding domain-containing protein [Nitrospira sp.]|nr:LysM peptidoglycan-binding domain-containing protein [Nitrospira sp.]
MYGGAMKRFYLFIISIAIIFFVSSTTYADITYTIKKGDNPYTLAKKFKVSAQDIIKVNNLNPHNLKLGTKITIPSKGKETNISRSNVKANENNPPSPPFSKGGKGGLLDDAGYHIVKKGDTLSAIARTYSMSVKELKEINNLKTIKLKLGQQILVKQDGPKTYTVKKRDNIYKIAKKLNIDVDELKDINNLETDLVKPGQKLLLEHMIDLEELKNYEAIISEAPEEDNQREVSEPEKLGLKDKVILFAKKLINIPYRFGGNSLLGIDCSAYVQKVYSMIGVDLPRSAREQFREGTPIDKEELSIGDLVFFRTYASFPSHVGIYLGNNLFIHASSKDKKVTINSLEIPYYFKRFIGARRLIEGREGKEEPQKEG